MQDVLTRLSAVSNALDRARFVVIASGHEQCLANPEETPDKEDLEKLFPPWPESREPKPLEPVRRQDLAEER